jgi:DNA-binding protein HU-alpha
MAESGAKRSKLATNASAKAPTKAPTKARSKTPTQKSAKAGAGAAPKGVAKPAVKPAAVKPGGPRAVPAAPKVLPKVVTVTDGPVVNAPDMKKKELIDLVVERSGIKKKDAKPVVEAMLAVLGESIAKGRELNLQPLGKLRINRSEEKSNGRVIVCKLRQSGSSGPDVPARVGKPVGKDPLAKAAEEL